MSQQPDAQIIDLSDDDDVPSTPKRARHDSPPREGKKLAAPGRRGEACSDLAKENPMGTSTNVPSGCSGIDISESSNSPVIPSSTQSTATTIPDASIPAPDHSLPTPDSTPQKDTKLYDLPELDERYLSRSSTALGVQFTSPEKFSLKPACWKRWTGNYYVKFAEHLRLQFDPTAFACETGISVDEIRHVFSAIVVDPLYRATEAKRRGENGMKKLLALYQDHGTSIRPWGKQGGRRGAAELTGVAPGCVRLTSRKGEKVMFRLDELSDVDVKYLKDTLTKEDQRMLWSAGDRRAGGS